MFQIAGLSIPLIDPDRALARLHELYSSFDARLTEYGRDPQNTVLCRAGCSHCCRSGGFFAVTLAEALAVHRAVSSQPTTTRESILHRAAAAHTTQQTIFSQTSSIPDQPGARDEETFSARVSAVTRSGATCALLQDDLCSIYAARPFLCRAYGYAVDAYAVQSAGAMAFRSLCVLYEGVQLRDYVRARDLYIELRAISQELAGRDTGRFTIVEAILSQVMLPPAGLGHVV